MQLEQLGWNQFFEANWCPDMRHNEAPARVMAQHREIWEVAGKFGEGRAEACGTLRLEAQRGGVWPAVGDWVSVSGEVAGGLAIREVLPRRTEIVRKMAGRRMEAQVLAANVDTIFVTMALDGNYNPRRLERYLAQGWETGARLVVLLNKADVCEDWRSREEEIRRIAIGAKVLSISAANGDGINKVEPYLLSGETVVLLGSSGVGKSTLVNRLLQGDRQATAPVRSRDSRGRHTTTARQLFFLPGGAMVIDTPGLRELQLWDAAEGVAEAFGDIAEIAKGCRFRDCTHNGEPGCAVRAAIERGEVEGARLDNHRKLLREQAFLERKVDKGAQYNAKERWKTIHRAARKLYRQREKDGKQ